MLNKIKIQAAAVFLSYSFAAPVFADPVVVQTPPIRICAMTGQLMNPDLYDVTFYLIDPQNGRKLDSETIATNLTHVEALALLQSKACNN